MTELDMSSSGPAHTCPQIPTPTTPTAPSAPSLCVSASGWLSYDTDFKELAEGRQVFNVVLMKPSKHIFFVKT